MSTKSLNRIDVDLWTIVTINGDTATMWFRIGRKQSDRIHQALRPGLEDLSSDDRLEAEDIVNTLFPSTEALRFIDYLSQHEELGGCQVTTPVALRVNDHSSPL